MSDILVTSPYHPFTLPTQFKAVFNGYIYCGTVDAVDPSVSQAQVYLVNESGDKVPVAQPLRTNAGGFLVYSGQPAKFVTDSNHSLLVRDSLGTQLWYAPDVSVVDPNTAYQIIGAQAREALRRSYAEAGYNLVDGSFEVGGVLVNANDVLLHEASGKAFTGPAGPVAAGTDPSSGGFTDRSSSLLTYLVKQKTNKQRINISAFGSTGTISSGSNSAWDNAMAFAKMMCPLYANNIGQSWFDLSGFEFVSDDPVYVNAPLKLRSTRGVTVLFSTIAADDFVGDYVVDTSLPVSPDLALNRQPLHTRWMGSVDCRYKTSGFYVSDFFNFVVGGTVIRYTVYGVNGGAGNELIIPTSAIIQQWTYTASGEADLPPSVVTGTAVLVGASCGDAKICGGVIAYYKVRGVRVYGRSCFITAGAHIYSAGRQAIQQEASGGNLRIDSCWLDSSRVLLLKDASLTNCNILTTPGTDSAIGVIINGGDNVVVKNNTFLGNGTDSIFRDAAALANKSCVVAGNNYVGTSPNADVRSFTPTILGSGTVGAGTYTKQSGEWSCDGVWADFEIEVSWSDHTGTGNILVYNLPFVGSANRRHPVAIWVGTSNLNGVTSAIIDGNSGGIKIFSGSSQTPMVGNGTIAIKGRYRI